MTRADIEQTVPARFEIVVQQVPDRLALRGDGRSWTYAELNRAVNRLAHAIHGRTPYGSGRVAYLVDQSPEMVIVTLAILKAGKTYVAIHPHTPAAAQREILLDVGPDLLLTTAAREREARGIVGGICQVLVLGDGTDGTDGNPPLTATPRDASTLFYTSGSTGKPKGVVKSHRAVLHRVWLSSRYDAITMDDRQSLLTHCSFSASESDMFGALLQGAAVFTFDVASRAFAEFRVWLESERITLLHPPVLFLRRFLSTLAPEDRFPHVRILALAGDVVLPA
ncbi:MAG TPA: AMP-binding protein, partial [Thermoanaerobaculia bacterium]